MDAIAPDHAKVVSNGKEEQTRRKAITRCPVCNAEDTLREARGMILCTHCFWALELPAIS